MKEKLQFCLDKISLIRSKLPKRKPHSEKYYKMIAFLNKYSLVFPDVCDRGDFKKRFSFNSLFLT